MKSVLSGVVLAACCFLPDTADAGGCRGGACYVPRTTFGIFVSRQAPRQQRARVVVIQPPADVSGDVLIVRKQTRRERRQARRAARARYYVLVDRADP